MCIRDSPRVYVGGGHGMWGVLLGPITGRLLAQQITTGRMPVSYTHLRAHETVLDLVCRLLLEKKKT